MGGELDGGGGLVQRKTMGDEAADVEFPAEHEAGDFFLEGEVGGIAAEEVFFIHANLGEVERGGGPALGVGKEHHLAPAAQPAEGLADGGVRGDGDDGGVQGRRKKEEGRRKKRGV